MANEVKVMIKALLNDKDFQKGLKRIQKGTAKTGKTQKGFFKSMKVGWLAIAGGVALFAVAIGKALKVSVLFEKAIDKVVSVAGEGKEALSELARVAGKNTVFSATEAADALFFLASAGLAVKDMTEVLEPALNLASAGQLSVAEATDLLVNNLKVFGAEMSEATKFTDIMATATKNANTDMAQLSEALKAAGPIASTVGIEFEELNVLLAAMADRGIKGGRAGIQLRQALARLIKPTSEAQQALAKYNISTKEISDLLPTPIKLFKRLNDAGISNADALAIFGVRQSGITALIKDGIPSLERLEGKMKDYAGTSKEMAAIQIDNVAGALALLKSKWEELILTITTGALPGLKNFITSIGNVVAALAEWLQATSDINKAIDETNKRLVIQDDELKKLGVSTDEERAAVRKLSQAYISWSSAMQFLNQEMKTQNISMEEAKNKYPEVAEKVSKLGQKMAEYKEILVDTMIVSGEQAIEVMSRINDKSFEQIEATQALEDKLTEKKDVQLQNDQEEMLSAEEKAAKEEELRLIRIAADLAEKMERQESLIKLNEFLDNERATQLLKEELRFAKGKEMLEKALSDNLISQETFKQEMEALTIESETKIAEIKKLAGEEEAARQRIAVNNFGQNLEEMTTKNQLEVEKIRLAQEELWAEISTGIENVVDKNVDTWATGVSRMIVDGEHFGATLKSVFKGLIKDVIRLVAKMLIAKAAKAALSGGIGLIFNKGGVVPKLMSDGEKVVYAANGMQPQGTDTVPAMLTPGERVLSVDQNKSFEGMLSSLNIPAAGGNNTTNNTTNNNQQDNRSITQNNETMEGMTFDEFFENSEMMDVNSTPRGSG